MYSNTGIVQGFYCGQQDRVDELNTRIQSRFVPDSALRPNYDPRPVSTKYSHFPTIDRKTPAHEYLKPSTEYLGGTSPPTFGLGGTSPPTFGLGGTSPPTSGLGGTSPTPFSPLINNSPFIRNIDTETILRNQTVALQKGIGQSVYVPSSKSDLYHTTIISRPSEQPFPDLFVKPTFSTNIPPIANQNIGKSDFFNFTRTQLRNSL